MHVGLYVRVSTQAQAEKYSLAAQSKILSQLGEKNGWTTSLYDEGGVSGETLSGRPIMQRLLKDAALGKLDGVAVVETERLCRATDLGDWATMSTVFRRANVLVHTPEQTIDLSTAEGAFEGNLKAILSTREKSKIKERTARGRKEALDAGRWVFGDVPYGYRYDRNTQRLTIHEPEAEAIRHVFQSTLPTGSLLVELHQKGIGISEEHSRWGLSHLQWVRRNIHYAGMMKNSKGELIQAQWEAIVPHSLWVKAQKYATHNRSRRTYNGEPVYLLTSIVRCAGCNGLMGGRTGPDGRHSYRCRSGNLYGNACPGGINGVRGWTMDLTALAALQEHLADEKRLKKLYNAFVAAVHRDSPTQKLPALEAALGATRKKKSRLLDAVQNGALPMKDISERSAKLNKELMELEGEIAVIKDASSHQAIPPFSLFLKLSKVNLQKAPLARVKPVVKEFIESATVTIDGKVKVFRIVFKFDSEHPVVFHIPSGGALVSLSKRNGHPLKNPGSFDPMVWSYSTSATLESRIAATARARAVNVVPNTPGISR